MTGKRTSKLIDILSWVILINALTMIFLGMLDYLDARVQKPISLIFVLLGMVNLVMNNGAREGAVSQLWVVGILSLLSLSLLYFPINYGYTHGDDSTVYKMSIIGIVNVLTLLYLALRVAWKQR